MYNWYCSPGTKVSFSIVNNYISVDDFQEPLYLLLFTSELDLVNVNLISYKIRDRG